jgi:hypothetical protein
LVEPAERRPIYLRVQEIVARELPYVSLLTRTNVAVMPAGLTGYRHFPSGELLSLREMAWASPAERAGAATARARSTRP